jgi:hypothetical protein
MKGGAYYAHRKKMGGARFFAQPGMAMDPYRCSLATFGQKGGACACNSRMYGGGCGTCLNSMLGTFKSRRGGYSSSASRRAKRGGYRATKKDKAALKRFRAGKSIGFTMRSSLKAKGLIPRANGTRRISNKYKKRLN